VILVGRWTTHWYSPLTSTVRYNLDNDLNFIYFNVDSKSHKLLNLSYLLFSRCRQSVVPQGLAYLSK
jgi:hypothetical protein